MVRKKGVQILKLNGLDYNYQTSNLLYQFALAAIGTTGNYRCIIAVLEQKN